MSKFDKLNNVGKGAALSEQASEPSTKPATKPKHINNLPVKAEPMAAGQVTGELTYEDVAGYSVRKAREEVPKIKDVKLLKYALNVANQRPNKETLCRILRKRIEEMHAVTV